MNDKVTKVFEILGIKPDEPYYIGDEEKWIYLYGFYV